MTTYADTSALVRLLVTTPQRAALVSYLGAEPTLAGSGLTVTELLRVAVGKHQIPEAKALLLLDSLDLLSLHPDLMLRAGRLPSPPGTYLRSADAVHIAAAIEMGAADFLSYDRRQAAAARQAGLAVQAPGMPAGWL